MTSSRESYRCVAFDFPGYGLSDKPVAYSYSLFQQTDVVEGIARALDIAEAHVVSHDVGQTVHAELLAREQEGRLAFRILSSTLLNGSTLQDKATITPIQRLLGSNETLPQAIAICENLSVNYVQSLKAIMKRPQAVSDEDAAVMEELLLYQEGNRRLPALAGYMRERYLHRERWLGAFKARGADPARLGGRRPHSQRGDGPRPQRRAAAGPLHGAARPRPLPPDRGPGGRRRTGPRLHPAARLAEAEMASDTAPTEPSLDPRAALAALGYPETTEPQRVKGGWETLLWRFATPDGREHSLRVHHLPEREEFARRERLALQACEKGGLPAPRLEAAGDFQGLPAMVLSWCPGRPLLSYVEQRPWAIWRLGRLFGRTQALMHALTPPPEFIATAPDDWLSRLDEEYVDLATHAKTLGLSTSSLIHMDFHPLNLISDGAAVTGVIDWPRAGAGDPRADLARTEITLLAAPIPPGPAQPPS